MNNFSFSKQEKSFPGSELNMTNKTQLTGRSDRNQQLAYIEISVLGMIFLIASAGNLILILVLWNRRRKLSRMYVFMLHLSLADLVVAFFQVLPQMIWDITDVFFGPDPMCRIIRYLQLVGMFASTYMIVVMTVDRFQAICYPMVTFQKKRALWNAPICTSWCISLLFSLPQLFIFSKTEINPGTFECWAKFIQPWGSKAYVTWIFIAIFFIPVIILIVCQIKICITIQTNMYIKQHNILELKEQQYRMTSRASSINCISKAMIKTVKMTIVTVIAFVLCWTPFFIVHLWTAWSTSTITEGAAFTVIMLLGNLNSCVNPWIYMYFSGQMPRCTSQVPETISTQEESLNTASIDLEGRDCEDRNSSL
ncbi:hypothetical protein GDO86_005803 [Hymenochirus boettgeri]|uniref:G-protein coupled receptors family 1 profile domain-containing protein n=1 Tax=Hymenochirus boettgeri TaxID=247094 RepID=A0A8T2J621_9PIPI|nr:hypothetical protein GDO86_005803 [Hymenochirus boettgeri]